MKIMRRSFPVTSLVVLLAALGYASSSLGRSLIPAPLRQNVFTEVKFWLTVVISFALPFVIYGALLVKHAISRVTVLVFGFMLMMLAGLDIYLLQSMTMLAKHTPSLTDDAIFVSEVSLALYLLPALYGGIGVNVISHILLSHLAEAEKRFMDEHPAE
jgi:hypothetical protein